jgi:uncharacterized protein
MWAVTLLSRYLEDKPLEIVHEHSRHVAALAVTIAGHLALPQETLLFIEEAALLHDIGVCRVYAPDLGLYGPHPYITHGVHGREILDGEGFPAHGLVCERHTGVGLTVEDIVRQGLPLPQRDMCPESISEQIICFADLFYSKKPGRLSERKTAEKVRKKLLPFGEEKAALFDSWLARFTVSGISL